MPVPPPASWRQSPPIGKSTKPDGMPCNPSFHRRTSDALVVSPIEPGQAALDLDPVGSEDPRLVGGVGRLERDRRALLAQALQRRLGIVDQRHDNLARLG